MARCFPKEKVINAVISKINMCFLYIPKVGSWFLAHFRKSGISFTCFLMLLRSHVVFWGVLGSMVQSSYCFCFVHPYLDSPRCALNNRVWTSTFAMMLRFGRDPLPQIQGLEVSVISRSPTFQNVNSFSLFRSA